MNLLEQIVYLLSLHGVDGTKYDRIDFALDALVKAEKAEHEKKENLNNKQKKAESTKESKSEKAFGE